MTQDIVSNAKETVSFTLDMASAAPMNIVIILLILGYVKISKEIAHTYMCIQFTDVLSRTLV